MSQDDFHTALRRFAVETKAKHGLEDFDLGHDPRTDSIELQQITVPRGNRKRGVGSAAMADLNAFADRHGKRIWLQTASKGNETGTTSPARLRRFYGRHGFVRNAGRRKDFALSMYASMYRDPKRRVQENASGGYTVHYTPEEHDLSVLSHNGDAYLAATVAPARDVVHHLRSNEFHGLADHVERKHDGSELVGYVSGLEVPEGARGHGTGGSMFAGALDKMRELGVRSVYLHHFGDAAATRLYKKHKFKAFRTGAPAEDSFMPAHRLDLQRKPKRRVESTADALIGQQLRGMLLENRMPALHKKWGTRLNTKHDTRLSVEMEDFQRVKQHHENPNSDTLRSATALTRIADMDPTGNKQYTDHLANWYHKGQFRVEDHERIKDAVRRFHEVKTRLGPGHAGPEVQNPRDFGSYPTIHHLERALDALPGDDNKLAAPWTKTTAAQRDAVLHGSSLIYDTPDLSVRRVDMHDAMKVLGAKTKWCVVPSEDTFHSYNSRGPLYHVHDKKTGSRKLLHFGDSQFMDEDDKPVDPEHYEHKAALTKLFHGHHYGMFSDKAKLDQEIIDGKHDYTVIGHQAAQMSTNPKVLHALRDSDFTPNDYRDNDDMDDDGGYGGRADEGDIATRVHVASNQNTGGHTLHKMATEGDTLLWSDIAYHPNAQGKTLDLIGRHRHSGTMNKRAVAGNDNTEAHTLEHLYKEQENPLAADPIAMPDHELRAAIARHPNTPPHVLTAIAEKGTSSDKWPSDVIAMNSNAPAAALRAVAKRHGDGEITGMRLAGHPNSDAETLRVVAAHHAHKPYTAEQIASNPKAGPEALHHLANYHARNPSVAHIGVIDSLVKHPNTSMESLKAIRTQRHLWSRVLTPEKFAELHRTIANHPNADPAWKTEA